MTIAEDTQLDVLRRARIDLAAALRAAALYGFNEGIDNHFSYAVPGRDDLFLLNPYGPDWSELRASDIIAEAVFQGGDVPGAATALNTVRARYSKPAITTPTLNDIMTEKYIALFQNPEVWNDYKRTCLPLLTPESGFPE